MRGAYQPKPSMSASDESPRPFPISPVIPAKARIHNLANNLADRNQA